MQIQGKTLLITGGTGSFGTAVLNRFLATDHLKKFKKNSYFFLRREEIG